ncbi:MAG: NAD(P)/FAD-dependent oxidoreductase [Candidatus Limnocylindrales bacterium]
MTADARVFDAIVIGAGHNGLVCAAYLARAGRRVLVLERREHVGGMAETTELAPGVRVPGLAHTVGRFRASIVRDLRLRDHGLRFIAPDVRVFAPQPDGRAIVLHSDASLTVNALATNDLVGPRDAARYLEIDERVRALGRALGQIHARVPPDLASVSIGDVINGLGTALRARSRTRRTSDGLLRVIPMAVYDLIDEWFESDALRAVTAARGVLLSGLGPRMPGTAGVLLSDGAGNEGGLAGQTVFARGGPGALTEALAAAARSFGATVRTGVMVERVLSDGDGDRARGVVLEGGEEIAAPIVVSGLDPKTTLLSLLEPEVLGPRLSWRTSNIRQRGVTAKVNVALRGVPDFPGAREDPRQLRGRIVLAPSMAALERASDPAKYGAAADEPIIELTIPSLADPTLVDVERAGDVRHVASAIVQVAGAGAAEAATRVIESYAPGFADLVVARAEITPADIERDYGAAGGHPMHAEIGLDQWFEWRPLHGLGRYRMPLTGFYLCGSGAHPGGGVTGAPGYLAALEIVADEHAGRLRVDV